MNNFFYKLKYLGQQMPEQATEKTINNNREKYFTAEVLEQLEGLASDDNDTLLSSPPSSSSVEDTLDILGNIVIIIGVIGGTFLILFAILEKPLFLAIWGIACILSSFISGYILKGLSKIISLLSSLQNTNSDDQ
jgi:hypothetical protein